MIDSGTTITAILQHDRQDVERRGETRLGLSLIQERPTRRDATSMKNEFDSHLFMVDKMLCDDKKYEFDSH